jgi:hypothetical protein
MHLYLIAVLFYAFLPGRNLYCTSFMTVATTFRGKRSHHETSVVTVVDDFLRLYSNVDGDRHVEVQTRRTFFSDTVALPIMFIGMKAFQASPAFASGGATAGRYTYVFTFIINVVSLFYANGVFCSHRCAVPFCSLSVERTIPIAKRRYYGRVQQAVHEFLDLGPEILKGDMTNSKIQTFFDVNGVVVVEAKRKDVNGQCTKKDGDCRGREIRDSRYNDMKASMYLLANAFRTDQQKPPDRLRTYLRHLCLRPSSVRNWQQHTSFLVCPSC